MFKAQCTSNILSLLDDHNIRFVVVPSHCTGRLQPLDVSVNKAVKDSLQRSFQEWYSTEVRKQLDKGIPQPVDLSMSVVKPLGAMQLMNVFEYMYIKSNTSLIVNGFKGAGILSHFNQIVRQSISISIANVSVHGRMLH